jgi:hypothetical protein
MKDKTGGPAFPQSLRDDNPGMTLLDYFAGKELIALHSNEKMIQETIKAANSRNIKTEDAISNICYQQAAAMIKEREKWVE